MSLHELSRTSDGLVVKRYVKLDRDQPRREWRALRILHEYAPGLAPEPVAADLDTAAPWITMSALPGQALGGRPVSSAELSGIQAALDRLHTRVPRAVLAAIPMSHNHPGEALADISRQLSAQPRPGEDAVVARAYDEALRWLAGSESRRLLDEEPAGSVLARVDHNLSNFLSDGDLVRLVDFEYAGRSDRCAELADLVEHISARCTPDRVWQRLLDELELSRAERRRLLTVRRLLAVMWLLLLLPGQPGERRNPPGTLRQQARRTLGLLGS